MLDRELTVVAGWGAEAQAQTGQPGHGKPMQIIVENRSCHLGNDVVIESEFRAAGRLG